MIVALERPMQSTHPSGIRDFEQLRAYLAQRPEPVRLSWSEPEAVRKVQRLHAALERKRISDDDLDKHYGDAYFGRMNAEVSVLPSGITQRFLERLIRSYSGVRVTGITLHQRPARGTYDIAVTACLR